jgi:hypothetical protein
LSKLRIFTTVWGDNHLDWFERACVRSLSWPDNRAAIRDATWTLFTKEQDIQRAEALVKKTGVDNIEIGVIPGNVEGNSPNMGWVLLQCLFTMMEVSVKDGSRVLMAPPDTIFSDGSIEALKVLGSTDGTCVAVPHPRVSPSIFGSIKDSAPTADELVRFALKHGHRAWSEAEDGHEKQNSFIGGVSWRRLGKKIIGVTHRLPTVYLAHFRPSDLSFFKQPHDNLPPTFGAWDHTWPSVLLEQERLRVVGSSDAAFILEVTKEDLNVPPQSPINPLEYDAFWRNQFHNRMLRQFSYIMREG